MYYNYKLDRILVVGRSGSGKTRFISGLLKSVPQYLVLTQKLVDYYPRGHIVLLGDDIEESINKFVEKGIQKAPITLVFEDVPSYIYTSRLPTMLRKILINGRHIGVGLIFISQRYKTVPVLIRVQSNIHIYFQSVSDDYITMPIYHRNYLNTLQQYEALVVNFDTGDLFLKKP